MRLGRKGGDDCRCCLLPCVKLCTGQRPEVDRCRAVGAGDLELVWRALKPLGFVRLAALVPTAARFDSTDDGAHVRVNSSTMRGLVSRLLDLACYAPPVRGPGGV